MLCGSALALNAKMASASFCGGDVRVRDCRDGVCKVRIKMVMRIRVGFILVGVSVKLVNGSFE